MCQLDLNEYFCSQIINLLEKNNLRTSKYVNLRKLGAILWAMKVMSV